MIKLLNIVCKGLKKDHTKIDNPVIIRAIIRIQIAFK